MSGCLTVSCHATEQLDIFSVTKLSFNVKTWSAAVSLMKTKDFVGHKHLISLCQDKHIGQKFLGYNFENCSNKKRKEGTII